MSKNSKKDLTKVKIKTKRLLLVPVSLDYAGEMFSELTDEITEYMSIYSPKSIDDEIDYINNSLAKMKEGTNLSLMVLNNETMEYLGGVGLHHLDTNTPEVGIWVKKSAHGNKIGKEAVAGIIKWAKENLDYEHMKYPVHKENTPSRKLAESLGGVLIGSQVKTFPWGKVLDEVIYRIP